VVRLKKRGQALREIIRVQKTLNPKSPTPKQEVQFKSFRFGA
jgi:hypothetical protein